jgi:RimJ/RimL family protein N-acetyltransferase
LTDPAEPVATTWDGLEIAPDPPHGSAVVVRRPGRGSGYDYLVLHRAAEGADHEGDWAWTAPAGARLPGEPIYPAALRELQEEAGLAGVDVWAVNLSGRWAVFGCEVGPEATVTLHDVEHDRFEWLPAAAASGRILPPEVAAAQVDVLERIPTTTIGFRPMTRADLPDVVRWQQQPRIARWWHNENPDLAAAEAHYGPAIDGSDPTRLWVVEVNGRSVGTVQDYLIGDHSEYALLTAEPDAVGFDYLVGESAWVGKGVGTKMLWRFLRDVVRPHYPDAPTYFAAPDHRNAVSLRVLDKLGFEQGLWFDEPQPDGRVDTCVSCKLDVRRMFG